MDQLLPTLYFGDPDQVQGPSRGKDGLYRLGASITRVRLPGC